MGPDGAGAQGEGWVFEGRERCSGFSFGADARPGARRAARLPRESRPPRSSRRQRGPKGSRGLGAGRVVAAEAGTCHYAFRVRARSRRAAWGPQALSRGRAPELEVGPWASEVPGCGREPLSLLSPWGRRVLDPRPAPGPALNAPLAGSCAQASWSRGGRGPRRRQDRGRIRAAPEKPQSRATEPGRRARAPGPAASPPVSPRRRRGGWTWRASSPRPGAHRGRGQRAARLRRGLGHACLGRTGRWEWGGGLPGGYTFGAGSWAAPQDEGG